MAVALSLAAELLTAAVGLGQGVYLVWVTAGQRLTLGLERG
jgi:hypothetical protein